MFSSLRWVMTPSWLEKTRVGGLCSTVLRSFWERKRLFYAILGLLSCLPRALFSILCAFGDGTRLLIFLSPDLNGCFSFYKCWKGSLPSWPIITLSPLFIDWIARSLCPCFSLLKLTRLVWRCISYSYLIFSRILMGDFGILRLLDLLWRR